MKQSTATPLSKISFQTLSISGLAIAGLVFMALPAYAHHPFGGSVPANAFEGFLSGLGHPVVGVDHLLFVIAIGCVGVLIKKGVTLPIAFVVASLLGTGLHLMALDLPAPETIISVSVLLLGAILAAGLRSNLLIVAGLAAIAGIFHGYAYGEAIVGAEMTPLFAYLLGFAGIQLFISLAAWKLGKFWVKSRAAQGLLHLRFIGFAICGAGAALLSSVVLS
ncbi:hydrogenase accessory protein HupE/UreJ protein, putative [Thalassoporum mexicanum PCC 7367]|uniref:HupE/UreJ family protein n=1 Tax=Thalassoporum mexicanum TaxID=3457544 RepID=UPI00029FD0F5|nr:HupE/UreJ family protein [Pseudanabaena sp. PCC 7367]AFY70337.1 hydrogenase accessory protein HupE/UreJ protein, putative [Pseudanabaena sp. PCC 7367]